MMKKVFGLVLAMVLVAGVALAAEEIPLIKPFTSAENLFKEMEKNKFAFKKNYGDKKVIVVGPVEQVGEGRYDLGDLKAKKLPKITLKGLFHAFLANVPESLDLADITQDDFLYSICTKVSEGEGGMWIRGMCQPTMLYRRTQDQNQIVWITPDKEAQEFFFTPEGMAKFGLNK